MKLHSHTPTLSIADPRGLSVRQVAYCRTAIGSRAEPRIVRQSFDVSSRLVCCTDPRLDQPSLSKVYTLSGDVVFEDCADAGWRLSLAAVGGHTRRSWDSRGSHSMTEHDALLRPTAVTEQLKDATGRVVERFCYGDSSEQSAAHNRCGRWVRHDDPAGCTDILDYGLAGQPVMEARRFLADLEIPDWPAALQERDRLLEAQQYRSATVFDASGAMIRQRDALGHGQALEYTCAGQLKAMHLHLAGAQVEQTLISDIRYNAQGHVERETAGNGVVISACYEKTTGRLSRLLAQSADGKKHQDLNYGYDPVGHVVSIEDAAQTRAFYAGQQTFPVNRYAYDSLYQLLEATGRESAATRQGPDFPLARQSLDPDNLVNYTQRFDYDAAGNLLARHHTGTETWRMAVSATSNRSLPQRADGSLPTDDEIAQAFDGNGNLKTLQPGQLMTWDARNQLSEITAVVREDGPNDSELYRYDGNGQRVRKVRFSQAKNRSLTAEVRYLPHLEIHRNAATAQVWQVLTVGVGRCSVRLLHWESGKPEGIDNDQLRYSLGDHLGSSTLELDHQAKLISHEGYYPFGGTAWWAARNALETRYKTVRYCGKERDATGLYNYGFRYYAPWLQRWISPDPARNVQGLNLYQFVGGNPLCNIEKDGRVYEGVDDIYERKMKSDGDAIQWRGLDQSTFHNPEAYGIVKRALAEGRQVFEDAVSMANEDPTTTAQIMRRYFGYYHREASPAVIQAWTQTGKLMNHYASDAGDAKFVGVVPASQGELAAVFPGDRLGRVVLNTAELHNADFPVTLAHEMTHLGVVDSFANDTGARTQDNFYLVGQGYKWLTGRSSNPFQVPAEGVSEVLVNGGMRDLYFKYSRSSQAKFTARVRLLHHAPQAVTDFSSAVKAFNQNSNIASVMASENADSITFSAYSLHHHYRSRYPGRLNAPTDNLR
ncbi:RHS repeat-associated core domain-containing protein [Xanthomonas sp. WHRI 1810A]|uniref:RHS repeat domain-containing protein n=1 Tax=Xanthomonas sp. WHRI 1810A TaxID=3161565 RepID=UPI0032E8CF0A